MDVNKFYEIRSILVNKYRHRAEKITNDGMFSYSIFKGSCEVRIAYGQDAIDDNHIFLVKVYIDGKYVNGLHLYNMDYAEGEVSRLIDSYIGKE